MSTNGSADGPSPSSPGLPGAPGTPSTERVDRIVVLRAAATGLLLAMPAAFANSVLSDQTPKPKGAINIAFLIVLLGFFLAGVMAGREAPSHVAKHGAVAAVVAFVPVEAVALLGRADRGDPISIPVIVITGLLAACAGTIGARLGAKRPSRREPS